MKSPASVPLITFAILLFGGAVVLLGSPVPAASLLFILGLYPGPMQSGRPGYQWAVEHGIYYWGTFICCVYIVLIALAWRRQSARLGWFAVGLLLINGVGGCARALSSIP